MGPRSKTQDPDFFEDLTSQTRQLVQAVEFLSYIYVASSEERIALRDQLHEVEYRSDELNHAIVQRINSSFITPFDREDLQSLALHLDDCLDFIDEAGDLLIVYDIADIPSSLVSLLNEQIAVIQHCADLIAENVSKLKSPVDIRDYQIEVNRLGNEDDSACRRALTALFDSGLDPVTIIKLKDIVQGLESCADAFKELANIIGPLVLRESRVVDLNLILVCVVIAIALFFSYANGFHDAANAIAASVSTRVWTPRAALFMATAMNVIGAMMGTAIAKTAGKGITSISDCTESPMVEMQQKSLVIILAALLGACIWNLITWWFGLPSSSSHVPIGGMMGAGPMNGTVVHWWSIVSHVVIPMFASPIIGFVISYVAMKIVLWTLRKAQYHRTMRRFRAAQCSSPATMALGHGIQGAQKTMGIVVMALLTGGYGEHHNILDPITGEMNVPLWVKVSGTLAISLGTMAGGGRIMRTIGRKIIDLDPARGFTAEVVSSSILYLCSYAIHTPISTTQVVSTAIIGVGCAKRFSVVRQGVTDNIVIAWFLILLAAALVSGIVYLVVALPLGIH